MKYSFYGVMILASFIFSCGSTGTEEGVLSEAEMSSILLDIYKGESELADLRLHKDTTMKIFRVYESFLFEKYGVDSDSYKRSLTYYYDNPEKLESIYDIIIDSLTLKESKIKAIQEAKKSREDSIARAKSTPKKEENN